MDLGLTLGRLVAKPVARWLDIESDRHRSAAQRLVDMMKLPGLDADDLILRCMARGVTWFTLFGGAAAASLVLLTAAQISGMHMRGLAHIINVFPAALFFFMSVVNFLKVAIVHYTPEKWWDNAHRVAHRTMMWELPELLVAAAAAALTAAALA